jgi:hypothetical protein
MAEGEKWFPHDARGVGGLDFRLQILEFRF